MAELHEIRIRVQHLEFVRGGTVPVDRILDDLVNPMLKLIESGLEQAREDGWIALEEAKERTKKSIAFFNREIQMLGGRSRLEVWEQEGLARRISVNGPWLINPAALDLAVLPSRPQFDLQEAVNQFFGES